MRIETVEPTEEPTVSLRFVGGRLQQAWIVRGAAPYTEWRDVPQVQPPQPLPPKWRGLIARDLDLSVRARNAMTHLRYDRASGVTSPATLGNVADMSDAEILRTPWCGRKTLKELRAMVDKMKEGETNAD